MFLLGYILVTCHKNNIVTLHVTFMLYRRNKTCLLGYFWIIFSPDFEKWPHFFACNPSEKLPYSNQCRVRMGRLFHYSL